MQNYIETQTSKHFLLIQLFFLIFLSVIGIEHERSPRITAVSCSIPLKRCTLEVATVLTLHSLQTEVEIIAANPK